MSGRGGGGGRGLGGDGGRGGGGGSGRGQGRGGRGYDGGGGGRVCRGGGRGWVVPPGGGGDGGGRGWAVPPGGGRGWAVPPTNAPSRPHAAAGPSSSSSAISREFEKKLTVVDHSASTSSASGSGGGDAEAMQVPVPVPVKVPPSSTKHLKVPKRPGYGTGGNKIMVRANHFVVRLVNNDLMLHHYDVAISPEVRSKKVTRVIMKKLQDAHKASNLGNRMLAYDGNKSVYTANELPFQSKDFVVKLSNPGEREREFKVTIKFAAKVDLYRLQQFLRSKQLDVPQETIQALDVVLREKPSTNYTVVGRSFFNPSLGGRGPLGDGMEYCKGFYQSIRPTQMGLSLNIDVSATSFYEPTPVIDFVSNYLRKDITTRQMSNLDWIKVKKVLRNVRVKVTHVEAARQREYKISGITTESTSQLSFVFDGTDTTIVEYFRQKYNYVLQYPLLPALKSGNDARPNYLPMEIVREQEYNDDTLLKEFGVQINPALTSIEARVLPPPMIMYHETGQETLVNPNVGQWNMINKRMITGGRVDHWACVSFSRTANANKFFRDLIEMCTSKGMVFRSEPLIPNQVITNGQIEKALIDIHNKSIEEFKNSKTGPKQLQLLLIILPDMKGSYDMIKRICETELGIVSQCCQPDKVARANKSLLENLALKINMKVGGRNSVLQQAIQRKIPFLTDRVTIVFGADVTHPQPGDDSASSIAAVVASMDWPEVTKYQTRVSAQHHRQEIIQDLYKETQNGQVKGGMIRELLIAFNRSTGLWPESIIFFRDGVSEGQFNDVLRFEIDAIWKACQSIRPDYLPRMTFIIVQKRHHTRLLPMNHKDRRSTDKSGNIIPGTVVDTQICHPTEFDFYLCSHAGLQVLIKFLINPNIISFLIYLVDINTIQCHQGTSRPAHYHVLFDDNGITADQLQTLTNNLCYTYGRCTKAVSLVTPAYYAHLAAFRARCYQPQEGGYSDSGSRSGGSDRNRATRSETVGEVRQLPAIKENVKEVMFFC
ncbi:OLC1v1004438C1 [Oldenlandia corymbosa var. corymbosa]|uniref:OLC1v1004438C1 n=1 Tax=Oldenlandia corymbosa var. corymbosa TaxID=529605 RepID=A0AAV1DFS3_OLDCO|nr:OLC1v1004438C1 [Oldenlandia corymbosa var. corymbosa]